MEVVDEWTGRHATALRRALRLTNEAFAEQLGTAVRTVARWNADPDMVPVSDMQRALDTVFHRATDEVKSRFTMLVAAESTPATPAQPVIPTPRRSPEVIAAETRLSADHHIVAALDWLDRHAGWTPGAARRRVADSLARLDVRAIQDRGHRRARVTREQVAIALHDYYAADFNGLHTYRVRCGGRAIQTSILTRDDWLDLGLTYDTGRDHITLTGARVTSDITLDEIAADAAVDRLAEIVAMNSRLVNAPIYRLTSVGVTAGSMSGDASLTDFAGYAMTMDLIENELTDAIAAGTPTSPGALILRDRYLPDVDAVTDLSRRLCVGGPPTLTAIARRGRSRRPSDYMILVQERSGRVLNAAQRLAVIPKAFHGPLADYAEDAQISATIEREMEEELFGRADVDTTHADPRHADPMHPSRLSPPMRWLTDHPDSWRLECTGLGLNLVSGNYEFASLIVIDDEDWWDQFGGSIEANWESDTLRRYSTLDRDLIESLVLDPAWSNEGLFALAQGLRRLAQLGGDRVDLPTIEREKP